MKKIALVTGGAGFIGSHMVDLLLKKNFRVRVIDDFSAGSLENLSKHKMNINLKVEKADIRNINQNNSIFKNINYVFHFAGNVDIVPSIEKPKQYMSANVMGTVNILESIRKRKITKFIYAASSSCYGIAKTPTKENAPIDTRYPYALSKYLGEKISFHWASVYKIPIISLRIFNAYGTRSKTSGTYGAAFGVFLKQKLEKKPFTIVGNGKQKRDFVHVTDVANAFLCAAQSGKKNKIYNLGTGKPNSVNYLVSLLGKNKIVYLPRRIGEPYCTCASTQLIRKELKWRPNVKFKDGVMEMLKNINYWKSAPLWNKKKISIATKNWFKYIN